MKSKRIASVSVNVDNPLSEETLIAKALKTSKYLHKRDALKLIKAEIKASGLYKKVKPKSKSAKRGKYSPKGVSEQGVLDKINDKRQVEDRETT